MFSFSLKATSLSFVASLTLFSGRIAVAGSPVFVCVKDGAVAAEIVNESRPGWPSSQVLSVTDEQVCSALRIKCPFEAPAVGKEGNFWYARLGAEPLHFWSAVQGKYEDGVALLSNDAGMSLVRLETGSQPDFSFGSNWYFNPGECR